MSYQTGEARILTLIQGINSGATWTATNSVSLANDSDNLGEVMLNTGKSYHYLILRPGPFTNTFINTNWSEAAAEWDTVVTLLVLKSTPRGPMKVLAEDRQAILDRLRLYARLNNLTGVTLANLGSGGPILTERVGPGPMDKRIVLFKQEMILKWDEISSVSQAD